MVFLKSLVRKFFNHHTENNSGFSKHPQTYKVTQTVTLQGYGDAAGHLILPVPASGQSQEVRAQSKQELLLDSLYQNNYVAVSFKLRNGKTLIVERKYRIKRTPLKVSAEGFGLDDYKTSSALDKRYLTENRFVKSSLPVVKKTAEGIKGKHKTLAEAFDAVNTYVLTTLRYGNPQMGLYSAEEALRGQAVDCGGYDTLFASICLALGIPARIVSGFWLGYEKNQMHAWVEIQLPDGRWMPADPSVEALRKIGRSSKLGGLGFIGSDRVAFSYGCDIKLNRSLNFTTDILQVPFILPKTEQVKVTVINQVESSKGLP